MSIKIVLATTTSLQSARSVKDAERMLLRITKSLQEATPVIDGLFKTLSRSIIAAEVTIQGPGSKKHLAVKTKVNPLSQKSRKEIEASWAVVSSLKSSLSELDSASIHWANKFRMVKGGEALLRALQTTKRDVEASLKKAMTALDRLGRGSIPAPIPPFIDSLLRKVENALDYESIGQQYIIQPDAKTGTPTFYTYIQLNNLKTEDGDIFPAYQIVLTTQTTSAGFKVWINTLREFELPGKFAIGKQLNVDGLGSKAVGQAINLIDAQLSLDHVFSAFRQTISDMPEGFAHKSIEKAVVKDDFIYVYLKKVPESRFMLVATEIQQALTSAFGLGKKRPLVMKRVKFTSGKQGLRFYIHHISENHPQFKMTNQKLAEVRDLLDLSDDDMAAIRQALKSR